MYIFCTDPPIEEYIRIYRKFQKLSGYKVPSSYILEYFWNTYKIPYGLIHYVLNKYRTPDKNDVTEEEFLELMVRWYNIQKNNLRDRIAVFEIIDKDDKNYVTYFDIIMGLSEINTPDEVIMKIITVLDELIHLYNNKLDFFDFLTFMYKIDPNECITID